MSEYCGFCKIASGEGETSVVYENRSVIAFMDLHPANVRHFHVHVIPRFEDDAITKTIKAMLAPMRFEKATRQVRYCCKQNKAKSRGFVMKPVVGKIRVDADVYFLTEDGKEKLQDVGVYIHVKGYERARVTHLDVESKLVKKVVHRGRGNFLDIQGIAGGIVVAPKVEREVKLDDKTILIKGLEIVCPFLDGVLEPGETTRTWVGRKFDRIYIGFRREQILKLEKRAATEFGVRPLKHLEKRRNIGF